MRNLEIIAQLQPQKPDIRAAISTWFLSLFRNLGMQVKHGMFPSADEGCRPTIGDCKARRNMTKFVHDIDSANLKPPRGHIVKPPPAQLSGTFEWCGTSWPANCGDARQHGLMGPRLALWPDGSFAKQKGPFHLISETGLTPIELGKTRLHEPTANADRKGEGLAAYSSEYSVYPEYRRRSARAVHF